MKKKNAGKWTLVAGVLLILTPLSAQAQPSQEKGIQWQEPSPAVNEKAKADNKFILADFYADWCGYCRQQDATSYADDRVILMTDQMVATKINEKKYKNVMTDNKITGYPTTIIFNAQGEEVDRVGGAYQTEDYVRWLGKNLFTKALPNLKAALAKQPDDIKLLTIMALIHNAGNSKDQVPGFLEKAGKSTAAKFAAGVKIVPDQAGQTVRALRLLSVYFQSQQNYEHAIPTLHYLSQLSPRPAEVLEARVTLADNFYQMNQTPKAIAELESVLKLNTLTPDDKQSVQAKLDSYKKSPT